jgi:hypothetical protein
MTEHEWWTATTPYALAEWLFFAQLATDRKLSLFSVACCQPVLPHLKQFRAPATRLLSLVEEFADGRNSESAFAQPREELGRVWRDYEDEMMREKPITDEETAFWFVSQCGMRAALIAAFHSEERDRPDQRYRRRGFYLHQPRRRVFPLSVAAETAQAIATATDPAEEQTLAEAGTYQVHLIHDIFGPLPFRDIAVSPSWLTSDVQLLAQGIYDEKAFGRMPILADALQDAGCDNEDILTHCREVGWEHIRGCWVIDLLLGRPWREAS